MDLAWAFWSRILLQTWTSRLCLHLPGRCIPRSTAGLDHGGSPMCLHNGGVRSTPAGWGEQRQFFPQLFLGHLSPSGKSQVSAGCLKPTHHCGLSDFSQVSPILIPGHPPLPLSRALTSVWDLREDPFWGPGSPTPIKGFCDLLTWNW